MDGEDNMMGCFFYLLFLFIACIFIEIVRLPVIDLNIHRQKSFSKKDLFFFFFLISPIIIIYTLRFGIGTDYFSYKTIFSELHDTSFFEYIELHKKNIGLSYVEPGYFIINRYFCFSFGSLLFFLCLLMFGFVYLGSLNICKHINISFVVFIYFATQYIYSMNGMRFAVAITIVFFGIQYILKRNLVAWGICIIIALGFHKTSLVCAPLFFLADFKNKKINKVRNLLWYFFILLFPILSTIFIKFVSNVNFFSRYFSVAFYELGKFVFKPMFLLHIVPVYLPMILFEKNFLSKDIKAKLLFRVALFEIPLRELGSLNTFLSRLARFPQMIQIVLVPYFISSVKNPRLKFLLKLYYLFWYIFYFIYGELVIDKGDSVPYHSIFLNGGNW